MQEHKVFHPCPRSIKSSRMQQLRNSLQQLLLLMLWKRLGFEERVVGGIQVYCWLMFECSKDSRQQLEPESRASVTVE
eukprot:742119-Rhodomonas_salina.2